MRISEPLTGVFGARSGRARRSSGPVGCAASIRAGRRMVKVEPLPSSLWTAISPPIIWQKRRLIASPSPVPPYLRVVEGSACTNSWNKRPTCSGDIPMPVSATVIVTSARPRSVTRATSTVTRPRSVNLLALLTRLSSAWRMRVWSACMSPMSGAQWTMISLAFLVATGRIVAITSSTSGPIGKLSTCRSILPASIFERSRMSLMSSRR